MMSLDDLQTASRDELKAHWRQTNRLPPPPHIGRVTMSRILICDLQWKQSGQSRAAIIRKLRKVVSAPESTKPLAGSGARLIREWNGREHVVDVLTDGYLWNGKRWRWLSQRSLIRAVTIPVPEKQFPDTENKFPVPLSREIASTSPVNTGVGSVVLLQ